MVRRAVLWVSSCAIFAAIAAAPAHAAKPITSGGFKGSTKAPTTAPVPPPAQVPLTATGNLPSEVVDDAGTAHIVWNEPRGDDVDGVAYCRLKRATTMCDRTDLLIPQKQYDAGDGPQYNIDNDGPKILEIGGALVILSYRYPTSYTKPDGGGSSLTVLEWVSSDGGTTWTGPAVVGNNEINGGLTAFGDGQIAGIAQQGYCGSCVQRYKGGTYSGKSADLTTPGGDQGYGGSLATDGGLPVAVFNDLSKHTWIRKWTGAEPFEDPNTWSPGVAIDGDSPDVASGPAGTYVMNSPGTFGDPYAIRRVTFGAGQAAQAGPPTQITPNGVHVNGNRLAEDPSGRLAATWIQGGESNPGAYLRTGFANALGSSKLMIPGTTVSQLALAATNDGGGFLVGNKTTGFDSDPGTLVAVGFGAIGKTNKPGLGDLPGGGGDPNAVLACEVAKFGEVVARSPTGCFAPGLGQFKGMSVSDAEVNLNGLKLIPDDNVKIVFDPKHHKIWSTGGVRVVVEGGGVSVTLAHTQLKIEVDDPDAGAELFDFDTKDLPVDLLGFPVRGKVSVILGKDSVKIPISLQLPPEFGGIRGETTLIVDSAGGLHLDSLHVHIGPLLLGGLQLDYFDLNYTGASDDWKGAAKLHFPPAGVGGAVEGSVEFQGGDFVSARFAYEPAPPGIVISPLVYLTRVDGELDLRPNFHLGAGARIGAGASVNGVSPVSVDGHFDFTFPKTGPAIFKMTGAVNLFVLTIADGHFEFQTDGYASFGGHMKVGIDAIKFRIEGNLDGFVDGSNGTFGASAHVDVCIDYSIGPLSLPCLGADLAANNTGGAACVSAKLGPADVSAGLEIPWKDIGPEAFANPAVFVAEIASHIAIPCHTGAYRTPPRPSARAAQAGVWTIPVPSGLPTETFVVYGANGPPQVAVRGPNGQGATQIGSSASTKATYVIVDKPQAGNWTVSTTDGSVPTQVLQSDGYTPATVSGKVSSAGGKAKLLTYKIGGAGSGQSVQFVERGKFGQRTLLTATKSQGTKRFTPVGGKGGKRTIYAIIQHDGLISGARTVGTYTVPSPPRPGRPKSAKVKGATISWSAVAGAKRYIVRFKSADGRNAMRVLTANKHRVKISGLAPGDRLSATITAIDVLGRSGPAATAAAPKPKVKKKA